MTASAYLGCAAGLDLATHCLLCFHDRQKHTRLYRWGILHPLYLLAEVEIIATDLTEMLGSAIALVLLFPRLQLWHGLLIAANVFAVLLCVAIIISKVNANWSDAFLEFVPSKYIFNSSALYTCYPNS
ncbi:hypothetical protein M378DRAFT_186987 [Amanita muscaria Koide BX008]|uniref:Uncharacterized protein n=1 Tax=Amanita muscaria (strain Koide BX008) TaxID=946122 RepID=A0A0C2X2Y1_AMAMK|nr:hypothetical protein M378DRAFT_186987 [Amanita muscaria Koide BX008]